MSEETIKSGIQKAGVCFNCLKPGHIAKIVVNNAVYVEKDIIK